MFREHLCRWIDTQEPFSPLSDSVDIDTEATKELQKLAVALRKASDETGIPQSRLAYMAVDEGLQAIDAARHGHYTLAVALFSWLYPGFSKAKGL